MFLHTKRVSDEIDFSLKGRNIFVETLRQNNSILHTFTQACADYRRKKLADVISAGHNILPTEPKLHCLCIYPSGSLEVQMESYFNSEIQVTRILHSLLTATA
jgi:hypothetical protein